MGNEPAAAMERLTEAGNEPGPSGSPLPWDPMEDLEFRALVLNLMGIYENLSEGIVQLDSKFQIVLINPEARRLLDFEIAPEQALSAVARFCFLDPGVAAFDASPGFDRRVEFDEVFSGRVRLECRSGRVLPIALRISPSIDAEGNPGLLLLFSDITEDLRREEEYRLAQVAAEVAARENELKSRFLATMSHELRTPMNGVLGMLGLLIDGRLDEPERELAEVAFRSAKSLLQLLNDILDFSKLEAGATVLEDAEFDVAEVVRDVVQLMKGAANTANIRLDLEVEASTPGRVRGDPTRLRQVLLNLVSNAVKFTADGFVRVTLAGCEARGTYRLSVEDTGIGISVDALPRLFRPFTQADSSTTRRFGGTGLGLSISRQLVESMGGHIHVESELGRGSTFTVELPLRVGGGEVPLCSASPGRAEVRPAKPPEASFRLPASVFVLVVDDNSVNRKVLGRMLTRLGVAYEEAVDGREALGRVEARAFSLVLMDCMMPVLDGYESTRAIRALPTERSRTPIVAVTANAMAGDRELALSAGMDDYLTKPLAMEDLTRVLVRYCAGEGVSTDASSRVS